MAKKLSALDRLKLSKLGQSSALDQVEFKAKKVFDLLSEDEYKKHVEANIKKGNFVEGGEDLGYADTGEDNDAGEEYGSDMDEEEEGGGAALPPSKVVPGGSGGRVNRKVTVPGTKALGRSYAPSATLAAAKTDDKALLLKQVKAANVDADLDDMLESLDAPTSRPISSRAAAAQLLAASGRGSEHSPRRSSGSSGPGPLTGHGGSNPFARRTAGHDGHVPVPGGQMEVEESGDAGGGDYGGGGGLDGPASDEGDQGRVPPPHPADMVVEEEGGEEEARRVHVQVKKKTGPAGGRAGDASASVGGVKAVAPPAAGPDEPASALSVAGVVFDSDATGGPTASATPTTQMPFERIKNKQGHECDTCLFYWLDAHEDPFKSQGTIHLFGKVMLNEREVLNAMRHNARVDAAAKDGKDDDMDEVSVGGKLAVPAPTLVSACLTVTGNMRCMFLLPREKNARTGEAVEPADVVRELKDVTLKGVLPVGSTKFGVKVVKRNYAFELAGVPRERADYLKLVYAASLPGLPGDAFGDTFTHVFGTHTTSMEHFLLKRRLLGPCWLRVTNVRNRAVAASHCAVDLEVDDPKSVCVYGSVNVADKKGVPIPPSVAVKWSANERQVVGEVALPLPTPDLRVLSLSLKTFVAGKGSAHEIAVAALVFHPTVSQDGTSDESRARTQVLSLVQHPAGMSGFSAEFRQWAAKDKNVRILPNEKALLTVLLQYVEKLDPDVLVGHNIMGFDLDVILQRIGSHGLNKQWSKLGRLKRESMPKTFAGVGGRAQYSGVLTAGRLLCDTYLAARELVRETTYAMSGLAVSLLGLRPGERADVEPMEVPHMLKEDNGCKVLAKHTENDAWLALRIMFKLQVLPLTKQLTNAAGNLWSRSLKGARAERIEYLLLHEFHRLKYIVPDKERYSDKEDSKAREAEEDDEEDDDDELRTKKSKKAVMATGTAGRNAKKRGAPAYEGGLVLEPQVGLYDKLVLLLDFNSLYPSIIQEYNLCFTTVERELTGKVSSAGGGAKDGGAHAGATGKGKAGKRKAAETEGGGGGGDARAGEEGEEEEGGGDAKPNIPSVPDPVKYPDQGVLPRVIKSLVDKRKVVKRQLAVERDSAKRQQLDIRQKAIKILANSMYGCLGFSHSRFHARPIAALVTSQGRDILLRTKNTAINNHSLEVIYGDTDSIMIYTGELDLQKVKDKGNQLKADVNKQYKCLEIDIDGIFSMMLLLKKKKYASLKMVEGASGVVKLEREVKGLDMVRRDWCRLSKTMGEQLLDIILPRTGVANSEDVVDNIHKLLEQRAKDMRAGLVPIDQYIITKGLNKHPNDYPDAKSQPHLQVAIAMQNSGKTINVGDHIPYVICVEPIGSVPVPSQTPATPGSAPAQAHPAGSPPPDAGGVGADASPGGAGQAAVSPGGSAPPKPAGGSSSLALRAYHPDDVRKAGGKLHVDVDWYLNTQIFPPVERMCAPIQGTSKARLASYLGLDPAVYVGASGVGAAQRGDEGYTAKHSMPDEERFRACEKLLVKCAKCATEQPFVGVFSPLPLGDIPKDAQVPLRYGLFCGRVDCDGWVLPKDVVHGRPAPKADRDTAAARLSNAVVAGVRRHAMLHQAGWLVCEDNLCGTRTRAQSTRKAGYACPRPGCNSLMKPEREASALHEQLEYYAALFNWDRAVRKRRLALPLGGEHPVLPTPEEVRGKKRAEQEVIMRGNTPLAAKLRTKDVKEVFDGIHRQVASILSHSGMHFVDTGALFTYVGRVNAQRGTAPRSVPVFAARETPPQVAPPPVSAAKRSTLAARYASGAAGGGGQPAARKAARGGGEEASAAGFMQLAADV